MSTHDFEGASRVWADVLHDLEFEAGMDAARLVLRERTGDDMRPVVPGDILAAAARIRASVARPERERRRAVENASAEAEWAAEKAFRAEHGMSRLEAAMKELENTK